MPPRIVMIAALVAALLTPGWAAAEARAASANQSDLELLRRIQQQVLGYSHYTVFDSVSARVENGVVTLTGKVTRPDKRGDIERRVAGVKGVRQVNNQIAVLPESKSDDELRVAIGNAIYQHQAFRQYAARVNPPIHIVVERGRVTLEGVVNDDAERLLAGSLAGRFPSFSVKNELITVKEAREELSGF